MPDSLSQRFTALDVFRGMTICFMIIVNTPGGHPSFSPLEHAVWNGFTPTDLVFPSFMFVVGNAMSFAMKKWVKMKTGEVVAKILKRTIIIFLLGYLMYWFPFITKDASGHIMLSPISHTRIFGVLQRIALAYGAAGLMIYFLKPRTAAIICVIIAYWLNFGFPINKKLWTSSFVLHTVGLDCMILACIIYWIDFLGKKRGVYFFQVFGRNPLFIYLLSELMVTVLFIIRIGDMPLYQWVYQNIFAHAGAYIGSLLFAITYMLFCWSVGYFLDKRKIYVRV